MINDCFIWILQRDHKIKPARLTDKLRLLCNRAALPFIRPGKPDRQVYWKRADKPRIPNPQGLTGGQEINRIENGNFGHTRLGAKVDLLHPVNNFGFQIRRFHIAEFHFAQ